MVLLEPDLPTIATFSFKISKTDFIKYLTESHVKIDIFNVIFQNNHLLFEISLCSRFVV